MPQRLAIPPTLLISALGIVPDVRGAGLDQAPRPEIYLAHAQFPVDFMSVAIRASSAASVWGALRESV